MEDGGDVYHPLLFLHDMEKNAAKLISSAILGIDGETVVVGGKVYFVYPPTIKRIAQASFHLSDIGRGETLKDVIRDMQNAEGAARALSCLIAGDESLADEFANCPYEEVIDALEEGLSLISAQSFCKLSALARNVQSLTAKQRL